ncbi:PREDICTED: SLP adapter and CSK-interacting membrane protein [Chinchilla lanigera]|uniref:SLP adaptor and CSK interacting membrane protein n=1 Tax=Chinchilla lanigera TaxID=34839 RepID=A0A8C2YR29_CHILA|nr:PREDICTED: SLP adapter and CSK-interacting membrane protein [Chinchilla lanigera]XP_013377722.1 PREDICTED: SLP adapter and CSK-interacting membrane protein [Chinchilla lanigera]
MSWWRNYFWIILAVAIVVVSLVLGFILYCVYRWQFKQGRKLEIAKPLKQNQGEEKMYENVFNQSPDPLPALPPRGSFFQDDSSPQEIPATYSSVNKATNKKTVSALSYTEPETDYDDVEIPGNTQNHNSKTNISSFWHAGESSHNLF